MVIIIILKLITMNISTRYSESPINQEHGLFLFENVIDEDVESELNEYLNDLFLESQKKNQAVIKSRQVLHFGYVFDYKTLKPGDNTNPIPDKITQLVDTVLHNTNTEVPKRSSVKISQTISVVISYHIP